MRLDWVVNEDSYGSDSIIAVPNANIAAVPLTYPRFMVAQLLLGPGLNRTGAAFPEGEKQFVKAVVGQVSMAQSFWNAGSSIDLMMRITKKPMDTATAGAITDAGYSLNDYTFANERFAWQRRYFDTFTAGTAVASNFTVRATVNQWLEPDEALYFMFENQSGTGQTLQFRMYLRTLMKADS